MVSMHPLRLDQLDDWSLLGIIDHLNFDTMINLAGANKGFARIIAHHYMLPTFHIHEKLIYLIDIKNTPEILDNSILFKDFEKILVFLRAFGGSITTLKFTESRFDAKQAIDINNHIQQYCSTSLTALEIDFSSLRLTTDANTIFTQVTKLRLKDPRALHDLRLDHIFPALEDLTIELSYQSGIPLSMARYHRNLKHFQLFDDERNDDGLIEFFRVNRQLRTMNLRRVASIEVLKSISGLKELESLALSCDAQIAAVPSFTTVHFDSVKHLTINNIRDGRENRSCPMTFKHLESLEYASLDDDRIVSVELLHQQSRVLKSLSFPNLLAERAMRILNEIGPFDALEVIKMRAFSSIDHPTPLPSFIEYPALKVIRINLLTYSHESLSIGMVNDIISDGWELAEYHFEGKWKMHDWYDVTIHRQVINSE